jgi:hemerythrin superfamily protein
MPQPIAYEDAVDLLDADHKAVKQMFIEYDALCDAQAAAAARQALATRICQALTVHAQIEEEIFYPKVRETIDDGGALIDEAVQEHAQAKDLIARIEQMDAADAAYDAAVKQLAKTIDQHVLEEREVIFLKVRYAPLDLRSLAVPLAERRRQLKSEVQAGAATQGEVKQGKANNKAKVKKGETPSSEQQQPQRRETA